MKELTTDLLGNKIEKHEERDQQQEIKSVFIGSMRKVKGLTLFEFNEETQHITIPEYEKQEIIITQQTIQTEGKEVMYRNKLIMKENCIYIQALNVKNMIRKVNKIGYEAIQTPRGIPKKA